MNIAARWTLAACALWACTAPACGDAADSSADSVDPAAPPPAAPAGATDPSVGPTDLDLGAVMRRAHFAFRRDGDAFVGGHATFEVRFAEGALRVTPYGLTGDAAASALELTTRRIARGDGPPLDRPGVPAAEPDGSLAVDRGVAVEHLSNTEDGLEQSFRVPERPQGAGALTLRIRASGLAYRGETAGGIHFGDPGTGLGLRVGRATWIDARGERSRVPVAYADGELILTVPEAVVDASTYPALLDPLINPELGLDNPIEVPAVDSQMSPAVALGGSTFLAVWRDERRGDYSDPDIYGSRITLDGTVLDPAGLVISAATGVQTDPDVAFDGQSWLVAWHDERNGASTPRLYGARVAPDGAVLDPAGIQLASAGTSPDLAFDGQNYLLAWAQGANIRAARVTPAATVLDAGGFLVSGASGEQRAPAVAWSGSNYLVVWADERNSQYEDEIWAARVTPAGVVLDAAGLLVHVPNDPNEFQPDVDPDVASDGDGFFVTWAVSDRRVLGTRVDAAGAVLDPATLVLSPYYSTVQRPRATFAGGNYVACWGVTAPSDYHLRAARVTPLGAVLDPAPGAEIIRFQYPYGTTREPVMAAYPGGILFAWSGGRFGAAAPSNGDDVFAGRFTADLAPLDGEGALVSRASQQQQAAAVAWNGESYLVAWEDHRFGYKKDIVAARLTPDGQVLDPAGLIVSQAIENQSQPAVASDGDGFLVVWKDERTNTLSPGIYATAITRDGVVVDPHGVPVRPVGGDTPKVAWNGGSYLVVWLSGDIVGARVTPDLTVLDTTAIPISPVAGTQSAPAITSNGSTALVVWEEFVSGWNIAGTRVTPAGAVLDPAGIPITATSSVVERAPVVASDGLGYLVVYRSAEDLRATRVSGAGAVLSPGNVAVSTASGTQQAAAVTWDGAQYWALWQNGTSDIFGARLSATATLLDANGFAVANAAGFDELAPALAAGPRRRALVAYHRFLQADPYQSIRVRARTLSDRLDLGAICAHGLDCVSESCTDGVCCNAPCGGPCQACAASKTGVASGTCAPITTGTDPDAECPEDALPCTSGVCVAGACAQRVTAGSCAVGGACYAAGAPEPGSDCATCDPAVSTTGFTPRPDGTSCASDGLSCTADACQSGVCQHPLAPATCAIAGACYAAATPSPFDSCQACDPAQSATAWTPRADGAACADDGLACTLDACQGGLCAHALAPSACLIDGVCRANGDANPWNPCEACDPAQSATAWTPRPNGAACADDGLACTADVCQGGLCAHTVTGGSCLIGGACRAAGQVNPTNDCEACDPAQSAAAWTPRPNGALCTPDNKTCTADVCQAGACTHPQDPDTCLIDGACHSDGALNPSDPCERCAPQDNPSGWTPITPCGPDAGGGGAGGGAGGSGAGGSGAGGAGGSGGAGGHGGGGAAGGGGSGGEAGHGQGGSGGGLLCVPGQQVACTCAEGQPGIQVCTEQGSGYTPCDCSVPDAGPPPDAGTPAPPGGGGAGPEDGCGCSVPGAPAHSQGVALLLAAIALAWGRRRARG